MVLIIQQLEVIFDERGRRFLKKYRRVSTSALSKVCRTNVSFTPSLEEYRRMWGLLFPFLKNRVTLYSAAPEPRSPAGCTCRPERRRAATGCSKLPAFNKSSPEDRGKTQSTQRGNNIKLWWALPCNDGGEGGKSLVELHTNADKDQSHLKLPHRRTLRRNKMSSSTAAAPIRRVSSSSFFSPPPFLPWRTGGGFLHQKNSWQINALPLGLIKLEGIKTTERLLWWTQCCASCALCSGGNFCHLAGALPAAATLDSL